MSRRVPEGGEGLTSFGDLFMPSEAMEPILARPTRGALMEWLTEIWAETELLAVGIKPRKKAIFDGPPGVGKTTLAHHLAARLGLPMLAVRPERLISKWVGETGMNIGTLFDLAKKGIPEDASFGQVLLFLDEFDALSPQRGRAQQASDAERNEYVNVLLQRLEQHDGYLIAATNFGEHIDQAIWRRFDIHVTLELPGQEERERIAARYLAPFGLPADALAEFARALEIASPALIRTLCENLKRQIVVGPKIGLPMDLRSVIERIIASSHPHPDAGHPRLWTLGPKDHAIAVMPWPLPKASEIAKPAPEPAVDDDGKVVKFGPRP